MNCGNRNSASLIILSQSALLLPVHDFVLYICLLSGRGIAEGELANYVASVYPC